MNRAFVVNAPSVVSEIIDGEVIVMNLKSGNYYSSDKVGAAVWAWLEAGKTDTEMCRLAAAHYSADPLVVRDGVQAFLDLLIKHDLVREVVPSQQDGSYERDSLPAPAGDEPFVTPELGVYTDMQDLLFLDPIHDVGAVGWPAPKDSELR